MVQRECRCRQSVWETQKGREGLSSMSGVWGFYRGWQSGAPVLSGIQGPDRSKMRAQVSLLEPGEGWGSAWSCAVQVVWTHDRSFSPGPSSDVISSREIIQSSSLTRSTCTIRSMTRVRRGVGVQVLARRDTGKGAEGRVSWRPSVSLSPTSSGKHPGGTF